MPPQLRSELIKLTSTRTFYGLMAGAVAVVLLSTWSTLSSSGAATGNLHTQTFFFLASVNLALFAVILGVRASTDEFRFGTIVGSVLADGHRGRLIAAKAAVAGIGAAGLTAVAEIAMVGLAWALTSMGGQSLRVSVSDGTAMLGLMAASALWAAIGVALGALVRHQVAAVVGVLVWLLVVENLGAGLLGSAGRYLPGQAAHGLAQIPHLLTVPVSAAVLIAYAAAALAAASISIARRDL
jgi:ABC-2 type transport system permease protein